MKKILITGSNGFVGKNIIQYLDFKYLIIRFSRNNNININEDVILHLAGKAHDLRKTINPQEYYDVNTELTKNIFEAFLNSKAKVFITLSSVKAVADKVDGELTEDFMPNPITDYGKSKLLAEKYILSRNIPEGKRVYILRPCMIHGPGNKGNLNLLIKLVRSGLPWILGAFENKRSFCSIDNLNFIINELIENDNIKSGIYNIADDLPLSTNQLVGIIAKRYKQNLKYLNTPRTFIFWLARIGDILFLPLNTESLKKLTDSYIVSNYKIKNAIAKQLPVTVEEGLIKTLCNL
jgi:nucleoside-diphosphate-sugar epimerase